MTLTFDKDFDAWAQVAKRVEQFSYPTHLKAGAIYWCHLGATIGSELSGKDSNFTRPVLIITKFSNYSALVVPCTSKPHVGSHYFEIIVSGEKKYLALGHLRAIDTKRIGYFIDEINDQTLSQIKKRLINLLKFHFYKKASAAINGRPL